MNTKSSRSHTIFQILLESVHPDSKGMFKVFSLDKAESKAEFMRFGRFIKDKQKRNHGIRSFSRAKEYQPVFDNSWQSYCIVVFKNEDDCSIQRVKTYSITSIIVNRQHLHVHCRKYFSFVEQHG